LIELPAVSSAVRRDIQFSSRINIERDRSARMIKSKIGRGFRR